MLAQILSGIQWAAGHYVEIIAGVVGACTGLAGFFLLIPGEHPEKELYAFADFISKFSKK